MTYELIILNSNTLSDGSFSVSGVFWLTAPSTLIVPNPSIKSQFSQITSAELMSLQAGTLVEQAFTTSLYASGTSLATVQSDLSSRFSAAQTALNNAAPVISSLVGIAYDGTNWTTPSSPVVNSTPVVTDASPLTSGSQSATPIIYKSYGVGRIPRVNRFGFQEIADQTLLALDSFEVSTINSWLWTISNATMTVVQSTGILTLNNNATTTTTTYAIITTNTQFQPLDDTALICSFKANVKQTTNAVQELGFGAPTTTTAIINNGAFFRINNNGQILGVTSYNGTENVSGVLATISNSTEYYLFMISWEDGEARFIVEDSSGIPIVDSLLQLAVTTPEKTALSHVPAFARVYTTGAAGVAPTIKLSSFQVFTDGNETNKPWADQMAGTGRNASVNPTNFSSTPQLSYNSAPFSFQLSSTYQTTFGITSLGGEFSIEMPSSALGDNLLGIHGFQVPAPYKLFITDIYMPAPVVTTLMGSTLSMQEWTLLISTTNSPGTSSSYKFPLTMWTAASAAPIGTLFTGTPVNISLKTPLVALPGQYVGTAVKMISSPTTGFMRGLITINGYYE